MKVTANRLTFLRIILLPLPCLLLYGGPGAKLTALGVGSLLGLTDYFDGKLARRQGVTRLGTFLDPIADKIFISTLYFFLARLGFLPLWLVIALLAREFLVSAIRPRVPGSLPVTWLAKVKTTFQMLGAALIVALGAFPSWSLGFYLVATLLLIFGAFLVEISFIKKFFLLVMAISLPFLNLFSPEKASFILGLGALVITWLSAWSYLLKGFPILKEKKEVLGEVLLPVMVLPFSAVAGAFGLLVPFILVLFFIREAFLLLKSQSDIPKEQIIFLLLGSGAVVFPKIIPSYLVLVTVYFMIEVLILSKSHLQELV